MTEEKYYKGMSLVATLLMLAMVVAMICSSCITPHEVAMQKAAQNMKLSYSNSNRIISNTMQLHFENSNENINNINYVLQRSYDTKSWWNVISVQARKIPAIYDVNVPQGYGYYRLRTNTQSQVIDSKMIYVQ